MLENRKVIFAFYVVLALVEIFLNCSKIIV